MNELDALIEAAHAVRKNAYAPYSGYSVGAAVLDSSGQIWVGCNVENISYGVCVCAERAALCRMVSEGALEVRAVAVSTLDGATPCGTCLQALAEFSGNPAEVEIVTVSATGSQVRYKLVELMPHCFISKVVNRTEKAKD